METAAGTDADHIWWADTTRKLHHQQGGRGEGEPGRVCECFYAWQFVLYSGELSVLRSEGGKIGIQQCSLFLLIFTTGHVDFNLVCINQRDGAINRQATWQHSRKRVSYNQWIFAIFNSINGVNYLPMKPLITPLSSNEDTSLDFPTALSQH